MPTRPPQHRAAGWRSTAERRTANDIARGTASQRGYGAAWRRLRDETARGPCVDCGAPWRSSHHLEHELPRRQGGSDAPQNLPWRCQTCSNRKTAARDGGFGNPIVVAGGGGRDS